MRREHSEFVLRRKLGVREFEDADIDAAIELLLEKNCLSDSRFAISTYRYRANRGYGWRYIENELKQKGVCSTIIQQLRNNCEIDWYLQAELAYNKRFGESRVENSTLAQQEHAKQIRFLQYRGFSSDEIFSIVSTHTS